MDSRELFSADILTDEEMIKAAIKALELSKEDVLIIHMPDDWSKRKDEAIVFESMGLLDEGDTEEYIGYYYYNIYFSDNKYLSNLKRLKNEFDTKVIVSI